MNILEMTDKELYKLGQKVLADKLGTDQVERFIRQCKPGEGDYSVDRHELLKNQPDIDTIVKRIQERQEARKVEDRERAERFAAPQNEIRKMKDIEIFEIGLKVLIDKLGVAGYWRFLQQCQEINRGYPIEHIQNREDAEKEIALYTAGLTLNPKMVENYIKRGNAYSYIREYDKAIADYSDAIKLKPDYARAYHNRGKLYAGANAHDAAITDFSMTIKFRPDEAETYYDRGTTYGKKGEFRNAIRDFSNVIKRDPTFTQVYFKRGLLYAGMSKFPNAIKDYDKALELEPRFGPAYAIRGIIRLHLKEWKNAKLDLYTAKKLKVNINNIFRQTYKNVADFERKNDIQLPEDIAAMLKQQ